MTPIILHYLFAGRYIAIFTGAFIEGPTVMTATGFLLKLGYFGFWPAYLLLMCGDLLADVAWYYLGYFGGEIFIRKAGRFVGITSDAVEKIKNIFIKYQSRILFFSKLTMGFGFSLAVLTTAGVSKVPFKNFMLMNFLGEFIWVGMMLALGYFLGNIYLLVSESLRIGFIIFVAIIFLSALYGFTRFMRSRSF